MVIMRRNGKRGSNGSARATLHVMDSSPRWAEGDVLALAGEQGVDLPAERVREIVGMANADPAFSWKGLRAAVCEGIRK